MRARRFAPVMFVTLGVMGGVLTTPASAGGASWISPERSAYVPADVAVFQGRFWEGSNEVSIADGPFIAYLLPANRWFQGLRVPSAAIPIGELVVTRIGVDVFHARVEFRVPDVPTGLYRIDYCNDPCTVRWLGDLAGSESFAIGATRTEGRLLIQVQDLRTRIQEVAYRARQEAAREIRDLKRDLSAAASRESNARIRVRELAETLGTTRKALELEQATVAETSVIAGGLFLMALALLLLLVFTMRRLREARVDAELHTLTAEPDAERDIGSKRG
jgi:hypothetical protein